MPRCKGRVLQDITTREESEAFQELAMRQAWRWAQGRSRRVDFSLAGGRKTMSASLALAAQCYGREQDRLFHVLVAPHCETDAHFYYPSPDAAADAQITLAPVLFPRLRPHLPEALLRKPAFPQDMLRSFDASAAPSVHIYIKERRVVVNGRLCILPPVLFALFLWFTRHKRAFACNGQCGTCQG
nr:CRISPR-associated ring nuclease [Desulfovibrio sp. ZJ369]